MARIVRNARIARALQHGVAIFVELRIFQMRVGVDNLQCQSGTAGVLRHPMNTISLSGSTPARTLNPKTPQLRFSAGLSALAPEVPQHARADSSRAIKMPQKRQLYFSSRQPEHPQRTCRSPASLPGPTEAATIMPFDSTPRSLRGARFATTTTFLPTSSSGV